jgi:glycosyltransferase involved in cell wall biosynthesis
MKIVHVITRLIVGGAQENTLLSCEGQHANGHDITLLAGVDDGSEGTLEERAKASGYRVEVERTLRRSILPRKDWATYRALRGRFECERPDVVHTHSSKAGILGRLAAWDAKVPCVVHTVHGLSFTASRRRIVNEAYVRLERFAAKKCHAIVCVADAMRDAMLRRDVGHREQYHTVYSGMDVDAFLQPVRARDDVRTELGFAERDVVVATVARLFSMKGHEDLLDHAREITSNRPHLKFLWIGGGPRRAEFEQHIASMNLQDRFVITGVVPPERVPELLAAGDVLAHPSRREGLARALPQAALCGLPTVCYDIDGNREGLIDGETGHAVPAFDVPMFVQRLLVFVDDAELRERAGVRGRSFATARFATETMIRDLDAVYRSVIE